MKQIHSLSPEKEKNGNYHLLSILQTLWSQTRIFNNELGKEGEEEEGRRERG
jgi:hypothetical protein